jgi:hypothetical protein
MLPTSSYMIRLANGGTLNYEERPVPLSTELSLSVGWNYIPYLLRTDHLLVDGLPAFDYVGDDFIKSQTQFATYYAGYGWFGSLTHLRVSDGYMIRLANAGQTSYAMSPGAQGRRRLAPLPSKPNPYTEPDGAVKVGRFAVEPRKFNSSMAITARVLIDEIAVDAGTLVAYVGDEVRGVAAASRPIPFGPIKGKRTFDILVFSNSPTEKIGFRFYPSGTGTLAKDGPFAKQGFSLDSLPFRADNVLGTALTPPAYHGATGVSGATRL